jgi:GH15 family glucan-1,4-alpha-glucosidase
VDVLAQLERTLGYHRHLVDEYYGGGEWSVLAGLIGWARLLNGLDATPQRAWIESQADSDGALPEQAGEQLRPSLYGTWVERWGRPAVPLLWSHAMYLILYALPAG